MKTLLFLTFITLATSANALEGYYKYVGASYKSIVANNQISGHLAQDITYVHITETDIITTSFRSAGKYYELSTSKYYLMEDEKDVFIEIVDNKNDPCNDDKESELTFVMRVRQDPHGFRILMNAAGLLKDSNMPYSFEATITLMDISQEEYETAVGNTKNLKRACFDTDGNVARKL